MLLPTLSIKKIILGVLIITLFFAVSLGVFAYSLYKKVHVAAQTPPPIPHQTDVTVVPSPSPTPDPTAPKNYLLLGYGGAGHDGGYLTDTMMIAHINPKKQKVYLISVPRDLWVNIPINQTKTIPSKINAAYATAFDKRYPDRAAEYSGDAGAFTLAKQAVTAVTGLPIDAVAAVDFSGFKDIVKVLNGVEVQVPFTFDDYFYPDKSKDQESCGKSEEEIEALTATMSGFELEKQFPCRYEHLHFDKGLQTMDGETALKFVRSRHSEVNGGDFGRSIRQQALLQGIREEVFQLQSIPKMVPLLSKLAQYLRTDFDFTQGIELLKHNPELKNYELVPVRLDTNTVLTNGTSSDGQYILKAKNGEGWELVHEYIEAELGK